MANEEYVQVDGFDDARGVFTQPGDTVAWAVRDGNVAELRVGKVEKVRYLPGGRYYSQWRITVRAFDGNTTSHLWYRSRIVKLGEKPDVQSV